MVGFITALCWIYILAVELVHALQALARVFDVTDAFVGLTILGPSQSLADLITNVTLARGGMPLMAAAACIAAPLLDILFGVGLAGVCVCVCVCVRHRAPSPAVAARVLIIESRVGPPKSDLPKVFVSWSTFLGN